MASIAPKDVLEKITLTGSAWTNLRPTKSFSGMTLAQYKTAIQPSLDVRAEIASLEHQLTAALDRRDTLDEASMKAQQLVVNGVRADPEEGEDGELYDAMGYVRKSERRSGLRRGNRAAPAAK